MSLNKITKEDVNIEIGDEGGTQTATLTVTNGTTTVDTDEVELSLDAGESEEFWFLIDLRSIWAGVYHCQDGERHRDGHTGGPEPA